jgi:hypothetical protein
MPTLKKILSFLFSSWWGNLIILEISTGIIVFCSTFVQIMILKSRNFTQIIWGFSIDSSYFLPTSLFFAIIAIALFYISTFLDFNSSLQDSFGQLAAIVAFLGILMIFFFGLSDPNPIFLHNEFQNPILKIIFRTLEYLFFSTIYLFSVVGTYMFFFYFRNKE